MRINNSDLASVAGSGVGGGGGGGGGGGVCSCRRSVITPTKFSICQQNSVYVKVFLFFCALNYHVDLNKIVQFS